VRVLNRADGFTSTFRRNLLIVVGLELEIGWLPPLISQSTNPKIQVGAPGYFDASRFAKILEIPTGQVTVPRATFTRSATRTMARSENGPAGRQRHSRKLSEMRSSGRCLFRPALRFLEQRLKQADEKWLAR